MAIGHFNISDLVTFEGGFFEAARDLKRPGSSSEHPKANGSSWGVRQVAAIVKSLREEYDFPIFLKCGSHTFAAQWP